MLRTEYNGNFGLDEIKRISVRNMGLNTVYYIEFVNDKRKLIATKYHVFLTEEKQLKSVEDLKKGDKIWIDVDELSSIPH